MKRASTYLAFGFYWVLLAVAWWVARRNSAFVTGLGGNFNYAFVSFAWLLGPLWFFAFGAGDWLRDSIRSPALRIFLPCLLGVPYFLFAFHAGNFQWTTAVLLFGLPLLLAALLEFSSLPPRMVWQDGLVLAVLIAIYLLRWFSSAWPYAGLAALPKLFVADLALYLFLVIRRLQGMGYSLIPWASSWRLGLREWIYFLPFAFGIGFATRFIHFHPQLPSAARTGGLLAAIFLLVAIPEEMFFRGILQNLLETRFGRRTALVVASVLFGFAHFNKGAAFNWRYVLLASIAGVFYGRAWRAQRQLLASVITHTAVDVVWALWFR